MSDYKSIVRQQEAYIREHDLQSTVPLKQKYLVQSSTKFGGRKRGSSNSGNVGKRYRAGKRRTVPAKGQAGRRD